MCSDDRYWCVQTPVTQACELRCAFAADARGMWQNQRAARSAPALAGLQRET